MSYRMTLLVCGLLLSFGVVLADRPEAVSLPLTVEKVWFREGKRSGADKLKIKKLSGPMTVSADGLEIVGKKNSVFIATESISMISLGKLGKDVDTEWVLLQLTGTEGDRVVGIRDGRKLGYGQHTREMFETMRAVMRSLSAAQYEVQPGYEVFDQISFQLTLTLPEDWSHFVHSAVTIGDRLAQGLLIFSSGPIDRMGDHDEIFERILTAEAPSFYLDRIGAGKGDACAGLTARQIADLAERASRELEAGGYEIVEAPQVTEYGIAGCSGARVQGKSRRADGTEKFGDMRAITDGETTFVFGTYGPVATRAAFLEPFENSVASVRLAVSPSRGR